MTIARFAPSPTGHLHLGGLRTALYNYLHAKAKGGKFLLRIEDTDASRNSKEALEGILEAFSWVGIEYENPPLYQSQRLEIYQSYARQLLDSKKAYPCYLSSEELQEFRAKRDGKQTSLTRRYRDYTGEPIHNTPCLRIKAPLDGTIDFIDGVKGRLSFAASEVDDFVILRGDGSPTYNFVVAIDDALSGISEVIRGDDHISNTPKQLVVYNALGFKPPKFFHIPMICNEKGQKLSKRDGALSVLEYREAGVLPGALLNFLFRLGYSHGDKEIFSMAEMLSVFVAEKIHSSPSACNFSKLYWLNAEYIRAMDDDSLSGLLDMPALNALKLDSKARHSRLLAEVKMRVNNLVDFRAEVSQVLNRPAIEGTPGLVAGYDKAAYEKLLMGDKKEIFLGGIKNLISKLSKASGLDASGFKELLQEVGGALGIKPGQFMQVARLGLLGKMGGIDLGSCIFILGIDEAIARLGMLDSLKL